MAKKIRERKRRQVASSEHFRQWAWNRAPVSALKLQLESIEVVLAELDACKDEEIKTSLTGLSFSPCAFGGEENTVPV